VFWFFTAPARDSVRCNCLFDSTAVGSVLLVRLWERSAV